MTMHIEKSKTSDALMDTYLLKETGAPKIVLEKVRISPQQVTKYVL